MDIITGVGVLDKSALVVGAIASGPRSLSELQEATGLPRATAHRLAVALEAHGVLRRSSDGRFDLGMVLSALGHIADRRFSLVEAARPVAESLRDFTGESIQLFVRDDDGRRCIISLPSPHALRWIVPEGAVFPLEVGSAGRVLVGEVGQLGWVASVEEREPGVASVSAPVRAADGAIIAALSVSGPVERMTRHPGAEFGASVVVAADEIAETVA
ncbi:MAG: IclR family transcriptional regulator [Ilumatobacter coccineus]|uniref:IclR family transcriptional regulator n=1 Tax=Ilumatobacter coccineus TaxID=467094 RepID=A0A2G6KFS5_9ACTN|nr:MAG: IclR family transcriptional regulator [Ilumatobacter coccineus]